MLERSPYHPRQIEKDGHEAIDLWNIRHVMTTKPAFPDPVADPSVLDERSTARLDALYERLTSLRKVSIGYPCNHRFDFAPLFRFMEFAVNNLGDPFSGSNFRMNTHEFEREVIRTFARLTCPPDGDR